MSLIFLCHVVLSLLNKFSYNLGGRSVQEMFSKQNYRYTVENYLRNNYRLFLIDNLQKKMQYSVRIASDTYIFRLKILYFFYSVIRF